MLFLLEKKHNEANKNINDAKIKNINTIIFSSILALIVMVWSSHDTVHIGQSGKSVVHAQPLVSLYANCCVFFYS